MIRVLVAGMIGLSSFVALCTQGGAATAKRTIAHEILDAEAELLSVTPEMHVLLDEVIAEAVPKISALKLDTSSPPHIARAAALQVFKTIDSVPVGRNFIYPGVELVQYLSEGLTPKRLTRGVPDLKSAWPPRPA